jgi:hypothetical protein
MRLNSQVILIASAACLVAFIVNPGKTRAQQKGPPAAAEVGIGTPLPVYVVNEPIPQVPAGFVPGSSWKFTTWTIPSTLTFTATVQRVEGGWAYLMVSSETPAATRWYYIPQMPGAWEPQ